MHPPLVLKVPSMRRNAYMLWRICTQWDHVCLRYPAMSDQACSSQSATSTSVGLHTHHQFKSLEDFYPFYASQHKALGTRLLHIIGTSLFLVNCIFSIANLRPRQLLLGPIIAYSCAWIGHFFVERNRPATFKYPVWSLMDDLKMSWGILSGREPWVLQP